MFDRNTEMDMTEGPLFKKLVAYAIPIMLTGILQLLFNAADLIVVGRFAGRPALAAVGSTTSLTNLLVNVFMMISIGVSVAVAQHYGAHEPDEVERTVSTAMLMSLLLGAAAQLGIFMTFIGAILLGFGIVQIGLALKGHDASQRAQGFMTFFGGVVIYFAKDILDMIL